MLCTTMFHQDFVMDPSPQALAPRPDLPPPLASHPDEEISWAWYEAEPKHVKVLAFGVGGLKLAEDAALYIV